jgi:EmrB/QacA subfamily drug resistance transporter
MRGLLAVVCMVVFLDGLDISMVGVVLPSIGAELGLDTSSLQWIVSGYVLGYGGLMLLGGRTADLAGRRKVFLIALGVFAAASLLGGLVDNGPLLIGTRVIKGVAAAFTAPTAMSLITTNFPEGRSRNKALSIFSVFGAAGYSSGLILGGLLAGIGWRWTFLMPVPLAIAAVIAGLALIPRDKPAASGGYDFIGAVTLTTGMLLAVYTVVTAPHIGWTDPLTLGCTVVSMGLLGGFFLAERRVPHPLVRLGLLRIGTVARANLSNMTLFGSYLSFQFIMALYLQDVLHWTPMQMALALAPAGILVVVASPIMGRFIDRVGATPLIIAALTSLSLGYVVFMFTGSGADPVYVTDILPSVLLLGGGFALGFSSIISQATSGVPDHEQGLAAGLVNTSGQIGGAVVLAVVSALVSTGQATATGRDGFGAFRPSLALITVVAVAGLAIASSGLRRRRGGHTRPVVLRGPAAEPVSDSASA